MKSYDNTKRIAILHNDHDAAGVAIMLKTIFRDEIDVYYCSHRNVEEVALRVEGKAYRNKRTKYEVFIADISLPKNVCGLYDKAKNIDWLLFDHHPTSRNLVETFKERVVFNDDMSASKIVYEHIVNGFDKNDSLALGFVSVKKYNELIEIINEIDLTFKVSEKANRIRNLFYALGLNYFVDRFVGNSSILLTEEESLIVDNFIHSKNRYIEDTLKSLTIVSDGNGSRCGLVFAESYRNDIANTIVYEPSYDVDYAMVVDLNRRVASLRSKGHDVATIAIANNGDGHARASAFEISETTFQKVLEGVVKNTI